MIKALFLDWDGTMTDGRIFMLPTGDQVCGYNAKDGMALRLAADAGLRLFILTGNPLNSGLRDRLFKLGAEHVFDEVRDKAMTVRDISKAYKVDLAEAAFMGDDLNDLEAMSIIRFTAAPADAHAEVRKKAQFIAVSCGGDGAVREFLEFIFTEETGLGTRANEERRRG